MSGEIILKRAEANAMLRDNRRRIVTSEFEVATAKLVFDARVEEFESMREARLAFESKHPWLLSELEEIPDELRECEPGMEPPYKSILSRWRAVCERGDKLSDQIFAAPNALQGAMSRQADFEIKSGQMISAASAFSAMLEIAGAASLGITSERERDTFLEKTSRIRRELIANNPHLSVSATKDPHLSLSVTKG